MPEETKTNIDEIEPETAGAGETGAEDPPECEDSPTGQHEYDEGVCVYCQIESGD